MGREVPQAAQDDRLVEFRWPQSTQATFFSCSKDLTEDPHLGHLDWSLR